MSEQFAEAVRTRIGFPRADEAEVAQLAALVCTTPFVPFPLLRDVRLHAMPRSTLALEARLCESGIVESSASDGFALHLRPRTVLREVLRATVPGESTVLVPGLREAMAPGLAFLSPLLRLEERIVWSYVTTEDFPTMADEELALVVHSVVRQRRLRILEWASGAFMRLPREVLLGPSAWLLAQLCRSVGLPHPELPWPEGAFDRSLFRDAMALVPQTVVGIARDGSHLFVGPVSTERRIGIRVPATAPVSVRVVSETQPQGEELIDVDHAVRTVACGRNAVEIITLDGRVVRLAQFDGERPPEEWERSDLYDRLEEARETQRTMQAQVLSVSRGATGYVVRLVDEPTIHAFLPQSRAEFPKLSPEGLGALLNGAILVKIDVVDRNSQAVMVRRVRALQSRGNLTVGQRYRGQVVAKDVQGVLVSLNEAAGVAQPEYEPLLGKLYTHRLLPVSGWDFKLRSARSYPLDVGDEIDVVVQSIGANNRQIKLRMAEPEVLPGAAVRGDVRLGDRMVGSVRQKLYNGIRFDLQDWAAAPAPGREPLPPGLTALVLNTELSWEGRWFFGGGDAREYPLQQGDRSELVVTGFHPVTGEVLASVKRLTDDPGDAAVRQLRTGTEAIGVVLRRRGETWRVRLEPWSVPAVLTANRGVEERLRKGVRVRLRIEFVDGKERKVRASLLSILEVTSSDENTPRQGL
ncbi:hypothetical protein ACIP8U_38380 [Streptomyces pseudovenezuelae]|uniref:hypothetical protein n=1 Tax=Streptomyces pseudovenezuelae TaxID=67350 RepID=UPI003809521F